MPPRIRLGICRADGYTDPSGSRISGPSAPARGQREAASSSASILPGPHCTSGLATITQSSTQGSPASPAISPSWAIVRFTAVPYPRLAPVGSSRTLG
ncbi:Uncharacterised protein [Mycobacterium tuberculosis]|nr:Uncharacterised protein [Mycobacterium tuberculosis]CNV12097.1 Uncharacterised protein [Mycobacterium tuberculosis]